MKKLLMLFFAAVLLYSCGDSSENKTEDTAAVDTTPANVPAAGGEIANVKGLELIGASDCMTCHAIDRKVIGPSYVDVANKYENNDAVVDSLAKKIKTGGLGNWGNIAMTPHPDLPEDDAKEMVRYILSLKNQQ